eukprot:TRINITY_DN23405_c0_g1_i1.p1 TRINITY_DN23405_c0_g1~~TRINITY_DN23405_c0_g1_i1.p1  ORF type:complete len:557 (-),score=88.88 TRINITY_DN23405_c0_g1_i1:137-1807(-)
MEGHVPVAMTNPCFSVEAVTSALPECSLPVLPQTLSRQRRASAPAVVLERCQSQHLPPKPWPQVTRPDSRRGRTSSRMSGGVAVRNALAEPIQASSCHRGRSAQGSSGRGSGTPVFIVSPRTAKSASGIVKQEVCRIERQLSVHRSSTSSRGSSGGPGSPSRPITLEHAAASAAAAATATAAAAAAAATAAVAHGAFEHVATGSAVASTDHSAATTGTVVTAQAKCTRSERPPLFRTALDNGDKERFSATTNSCDTYTCPAERIRKANCQCESITGFGTNVCCEDGDTDVPFSRLESLETFVTSSASSGCDKPKASPGDRPTLAFQRRSRSYSCLLPDTNMLHQPIPNTVEELRSEASAIWKALAILKQKELEIRKAQAKQAPGRRGEVASVADKPALPHRRRISFHKSTRGGEGSSDETSAPAVRKSPSRQRRRSSGRSSTRTIQEDKLSKRLSAAKAAFAAAKAMENVTANSGGDDEVHGGTGDKAVNGDVANAHNTFEWTRSSVDGVLKDTIAADKAEQRMRRRRAHARRLASAQVAEKMKLMNFSFAEDSHA